MRSRSLLPADDPQLRAVRVVRERLDHVRAGVDEVSVELLDEIGVFEDHLRHEGARLEIAAPLELEEVPLGADDGPGGEPLEKTGPDSAW